MNKDEALQLALETLENFYHYGYYRLDCFRTINTIKEALETKEGLLDRKSYLLGLYDQKSRLGLETKDKPVAYQDIKEKCKIEVVPAKGGLLRKWVGLTDDEVYKIAFALEGEHWKKIADAIEAKLKEKNT
jgi:hypothetical protein